jgi:putative ABC transport system substrate-binding protein
MTSRRHLLVASVFGAIAPRFVLAQTPAKIGMLSPRPLSESTYAPGIVARLGELGYRDGTTMRLEFRSANGHTDRYTRLARELIEAKCNIIFTLGTEPTAPFRDAGYPVPVVFMALDADPLERKLVTSLRSPGVNATGIYRPENALVGKRLELMRELALKIRHVLVFTDVATRTQLPAVRKGAQHAGMQLTVVEFAKPPYDYEAAFAAAQKAGVGALMALSSPVFSTDRAAISALSAKYRLPSIGASSQMAEAGFLLSLHPDAIKMARRAAELGVRVLKGAKPADIAVEQADEFDLAVNAKTARTLGVKIPQSVFARATKIVQ